MSNDQFQWQPIKTAPKDGRRFVVLKPQRYRSSDYKPDICYWEKKMDRLIFDNWLEGPQPTHWMPLPPAPEEGGGVIPRMENWLVKPEYSLEWMIMTRAQMVAFMNWTSHPCKVKPYQAWSWGDSGVEE